MASNLTADSVAALFRFTRKRGGSAESAAENLVEHARQGDVRGTKVILESELLDPKEAELILYCACIAARLGHAEVLTVLVQDRRVMKNLWNKRDLKVKLGSVDLADRGVTRTVTVAQEILHAICRGGFVETAEAFFGCLTRGQIGKLVKKAGRSRTGSDWSSSFDGSEKGSSTRGTMQEMRVYPEDDSEQDAGDDSHHKSKSRHTGTMDSSDAAGYALAPAGMWDKHSGLDEEDEEDGDSDNMHRFRNGLVGQIFESIAQRSSDQRSVFEITAAEGHFELMQYLADIVGFDLSYHAQDTLDAATLHGSLEMVCYLLEKKEVSSCASLAVLKVLQCNNREIVKLWIEKNDLKTIESEVHQRYACDFCTNSPIVGPRFRSIAEGSSHYSTFDLCENCVKTVPWESLPDDIRGSPMLQVNNVSVLSMLENCIGWLNSNSRGSGRARARTDSVEDDFPELNRFGSTSHLSKDGSLTAMASKSRLRGLSVTSIRTTESKKRTSLVRRMCCLVGKAAENARQSIPRRRQSSNAGSSSAVRRSLIDGRVDRLQKASSYQIFAMLLDAAVEAKGLAVHFPPDPTVDVKEVALTQLLRGLWKPTVLLRVLRATVIAPSKVMQPFFLWACKEERDTALPLIQRSSDQLGLTQEQAAKVVEGAHELSLFHYMCKTFSLENPTREFDLVFAEGKNIDRAIVLLDEGQVDIVRAAKRSLVLDIRNEVSSYLGDAIYAGNLDLAYKLLEYPNVKPCEPKNDPFWSACKAGNVEFVKLFLKNEGWIKPRISGEHEALCNKCGELIDGTRYKCRLCFDFDLCFSCMRRGAAQSHSTEHDESSIVALRDPIFWEAPRVAIKAGHVEVVRLLFEDERFFVFPIYFLWAVGSYNMTKLMLEYSQGSIVDLDYDLVVSQATLKPKVLKLLLQDERFDVTENALFTAILNGVPDSVKTLLEHPHQVFGPRTFERALPFSLLQDVSILESILAHLPSDTWIDLMRSMVDENFWLLIQVDKLEMAIEHPTIAPRTNEEALRFLEAAVFSGRPKLVKWWLYDSPKKVRAIAQSAALDSMEILTGLTGRLAPGSRDAIKAHLQELMEE